MGKDLGTEPECQLAKSVRGPCEFRLGALVRSGLTANETLRGDVGGRHSIWLWPARERDRPESGFAQGSSLACLQVPACLEGDFCRASCGTDMVPRLLVVLRVCTMEAPPLSERCV
jgi:hypothetical protein